MLFHCLFRFTVSRSRPTEFFVSRERHSDKKSTCWTCRMNLVNRPPSRASHPCRPGIILRGTSAWRPPGSCSKLECLRTPSSRCRRRRRLCKFEVRSYFPQIYLFRAWNFKWILIEFDIDLIYWIDFIYCKFFLQYCNFLWLLFGIQTALHYTPYIYLYILFRHVRRPLRRRFGQLGG